MRLIRKSRNKKRPSFRITSPFVSRILIVLIVLLVLALLKIPIFMVLFLVISIFFNAWLAGFQMKRGLPTDFELSTISTVLITANYGLGWGIFTAIASKLFASISTGNIVADHFFMIATYINAALWTYFLKGVIPILPLGMLIVAVNAIIMFNISRKLGIEITANLSYTGTNLIFNMIIFSIFAEPLNLIL